MHNQGNCSPQASFEVFAAVQLGMPFLWVRTLRRREFFPDVSRYCNGRLLKFMGLSIPEDEITTLSRIVREWLLSDVASCLVRTENYIVEAWKFQEGTAFNIPRFEICTMLYI
jgi:hypothetical protein